MRKAFEQKTKKSFRSIFYILFCFFFFYSIPWDIQYINNNLDYTCLMRLFSNRILEYTIVIIIISYMYTIYMHEVSGLNRKIKWRIIKIVKNLRIILYRAIKLYSRSIVTIELKRDAHWCARYIFSSRKTK